MSREPRRRVARPTGVRRAPVLLLLTVAVVLTSAACGSGTDDGAGDRDGGSPPPATAAADPLAGRTFVAVEVTEGDAPRPLVAGTELRFAFERGIASARAGCNDIGGRYRLEDGVLVVDEVTTTEMGCDPPRHEQDEWLAAFLSSRPEVQVDGPSLRLRSGATVVTATDREVASPDVALEGTTWTLETIVEGEVASSVPQGVTSTLTFTADGTYRFTGCNTGGGRVQVGDRTLTFERPNTTRMRCGGDRGRVEAAVLALLRGEVAYEVEESTLTLVAGDRSLGYRSGG